MAEWWPRAHNVYFCPFTGFHSLPFLKIFLSDFSGTMKAGRLKVRINIDNDLMYRVYRIRGQRSITLGVMLLGRFSKH